MVPPLLPPPPPLPPPRLIDPDEQPRSRRARAAAHTGATGCFDEPRRFMTYLPEVAGLGTACARRGNYALAKGGASCPEGQKWNGAHAGSGAIAGEAAASRCASRGKRARRATISAVIRSGGGVHEGGQGRAEGLGGAAEGRSTREGRSHDQHRRWSRDGSNRRADRRCFACRSVAGGLRRERCGPREKRRARPARGLV